MHLGPTLYMYINQSEFSQLACTSMRAISKTAQCLQFLSFKDSGVNLSKRCQNDAILYYNGSTSTHWWQQRYCSSMDRCTCTCIHVLCIDKELSSTKCPGVGLLKRYWLCMCEVLFFNWHKSIGWFIVLQNNLLYPYSVFTSNCLKNKMNKIGRCFNPNSLDNKGSCWIFIVL